MTCPNCTNPECDGLCVGGSRSVPEKRAHYASALATMALMQNIAAQESARARRRRVAVLPRPAVTNNPPEIQAWNKAIEERKAAKRAAKAERK